MMRATALLVGVMLILSGCITGGSETDEDPVQETQSLSNGSVDTNGTPENASDNATYLKNDDYNQTHVHDYWPGNSTQKVLMDETVETDTFFSVFYTAFSPLFQDPKTGVGVTWFSLPNGSFVPVGTGELVVEVDATGALENGQMALRYNPADSSEYTKMDPQGAQATWTIPVEPTMTDPPHSKSTRWAFVLEADGTGAVLDGEINVKITAEKTRELEAWPEHPDFWDKGHKTRLHLFNKNGTYDELGSFIVDAARGQQSEEPVTFPEGTIVPPETKVLLVKFWYGRDTHAKNAANGDVTLRVKEGSSSNWYGSTYDDEVRDEQNFKMFAIPVDGSNWDSPYAEQSSWAFQVWAPTGARVPQEDASLTMGLGESGSGNFTLDATAYRVVPPWLQSMMQDDDYDDRARSDR